MYYLMLDTETTNSIEEPLCYDIGFSVINEYGYVYEVQSYVVADIFLDDEMMENAYFKDKIPQYWREIKSGKRVLTSFTNILFKVRETMKKYDTKYVVAHNMRFDYLSTNLTERFLTKSKYRFFFPYNTVFLDTLKMSKEVFGEDKDYIKFCEDNGFCTTYHKPRFTAEILYRYLTNDLNFEERHTGLEDTLIEGKIFAECLRRKPNVNCRLWD